MPANSFSPPETEVAIPPRVATLDPMTGRRISSLTAAALCVEPRGEMTPRQIVNVDVLKAASEEFTTLRGLAMRFAGLLRGGDIGKLDVWLHDARHCGLHAMRSFVRKLGVSRDWGDQDGIDIADLPLAGLGTVNGAGFAQDRPLCLWFPAVVAHCLSGVIPPISGQSRQDGFPRREFQTHLRPDGWP
jgi:hypothetical protein